MGCVLGAPLERCVGPAQTSTVRASRRYHLVDTQGLPAVSEELASFSLVHYRLCGSREAGARAVRRNQAVEKKKAKQDVARMLLDDPAPLDDGAPLDDPALWAELLADDDINVTMTGDGTPVIARAVVVSTMAAPSGQARFVAGAVDAMRGVAYAECRLEREARLGPASFAFQIVDARSRRPRRVEPRGASSFLGGETLPPWTRVVVERPVP